MATNDRGYLRFPAIHDEAMVFVCDDDLWRVPVSGGLAYRLTAGLGEPATPAFSPDGKWLAYVSRDEVHPEVYLMAADGGPARRMTWLGANFLNVRGFTPDGHIIFTTPAGQPFFRNFRAYTLGLDDPLPEVLPLGQVDHLAYGPRSGTSQAMLIGRNTRDPAWWKRYRGGTAGHLWIDAGGSGEYRRMGELQGNITSPMWLGNRVYFLSDWQGIGNLYSCLPDGKDLRRHSDHAEYYARHATTDGRRIVYQCGADLWLYDPASDQANRIDIRVPAHRTQAARKFVPAADYLGGVHVHPQGHSIALEARGKLFAGALWEGAMRQLGDATIGRQRHGQWLADGTTLVAVSDASGEERVVVHAGGAERTLSWNVGRVIALRAAPVGTLVALSNHRQEVLIGDVATGSVRVIDKSDAGRTEELAWSPDGAWLAYPLWINMRHCAIKLHDVNGGDSRLVTQPDFRDWSPSFDPDGKYLYFLSARTFDPVYDNVQFELSFPRAARPYLIALQSDSPPPFDPAPRGVRSGSPNNGRKEAEASKPDPGKPVRVDLDGIERRVAAFPVPEGRYGQVAGIAAGWGEVTRVVWSNLPIPGAHGRGGHKDGPGKLEVFDFATLRTEVCLERVEQFMVAADGGTLIARDGKKLRAVEAGKKPDAPAETSGEEASRKTGWIDLNRVRASIEPRAEWRQMLREIWRLQRDQFWVEDMSGVDWNAMLLRYEPLLERVATRGEFTDLVWELQGELGTSHAYEQGGDHRKPPQVMLGKLAADLKLAADGSFEITGIVRGDPWDAEADSPLGAVGVSANLGERIVAVNGQPVSRVAPPQSLLVHQAGTKVELALKSGSTTRHVLVKTLADEAPARYREWVERNRAWVHEHSKQQVGYLHLPDMQSAGFAEFHRYFIAECDRAGLIVDLRYNRGGHVSQLLLEKLARRRIGYDLQRWGQPQPYPAEAPLGPVVALTNEHAGSDGDIFSHCFKLMKLGTLVGKRTWGGVIGIWPRHKLADGSETTQPEFSFWFQDVGWKVENYGTDPDIDIDNAPQDAATGRDAQLEKALETALRQVAEHKPAVPSFGERPSLRPGALPPRP